MTRKHAAINVGLKADYAYYIPSNNTHNKCPLVLVKRHCNVWSAHSYFVKPY